MLLCGNGTSTSDDSSAEVSSIAYVLFTSRGSPCASLMMIILALQIESLLSLLLSKVFKSMTGHPVDKDILWTNHIRNRSMYIRGRAPSIWGLHPDTIAHVVSHMLLFGLIWRECIDTFQSDVVAMNQVGRGSQWQHIILRGDIVPIDCFHYGALFPCCDLFHILMTLFHNAITGGYVCTMEMQSDSLPIRLESS